MTLKSLQNVRIVAVIAVVAVAAIAGGRATKASAAGTCALPEASLALLGLGDSNPYFLAPGGNFEGDTSGWSLTGEAGITTDNESWNVGSESDSQSLALPTTSATATTATFCVTTQAPTFRMFIKNNGNLGHIDGQLAVYLNFTGADGRVQQVKIAALKVKSTAWTLSQPISFIQYLSTPLRQEGLANVSFTIKPNDNHGNWQIDDMYVDPYMSR